jgi:NADP-dependent 3-hydroxy acid dehydrogenase YdfG
MTIKNKIILITGGSSGIGKAAAIQLAQKGATVILQARSLDRLKAAATEIRKAGGTAHYFSTDLTDFTSVEKWAVQIIKEVGLPDIVINSAGSGEWLSLKEAAVDHFKTSMDSPYLATAYTCKVFYDKMQERGNGHFIIINSAACFFSFASATGYTAARWAMLGFAKSLQADLFDSDFKVSMIALGKVDSPYFTTNPVSEEKIPKIVKYLIPTMSTKESGRVIVKTVLSEKNMVVKPFMMDVCVRLNRLFPGLFRWIIRIV